MNDQGMTASSTTSRAHTITALLLIVCVAIWAFLAWNAPIDRVQGVIQKILYVHVPMAIGTYLGFICTALGGALYLWKGEERWDRFALSSAEIGVLFAVMMLISGPIWGKGTWGKWWSWDLRLTLTLLLFFVYVAYLLLRSFTEGSERAARFAAVYGIAGLALIPLNYFAIKLAAGRSIHPENLGGDSLGTGMGWPFFMGMVAMVAVFAFLLVRRLEVGSLRAEQTRRLALANREGMT
ncbi:MAG: cytochrome c biogenesis protein CcsA [Deltaproteobacteria bacterium]|nr:cytochrome c biogenesis protein CcsA [Deltaproteobacteria bacterium]MBW2395177.1 cytochrome c biogenesis protein CcsA [Deltaproteobacteria bacterium]